MRGCWGSVWTVSLFPCSTQCQGCLYPKGRGAPGGWGEHVRSRRLPCSSPSQFIHPHRFWASVEPYCADLTNEEVRVLEELLKPPEDEAEHYKVKNSRAHPEPPLLHPLLSLPDSSQPSAAPPLPCLTASISSPGMMPGGRREVRQGVPRAVPSPAPADPAAGETLLPALGSGGPAGGAEGRSPGGSCC